MATKAIPPQAIPYDDMMPHLVVRGKRASSGALGPAITAADASVSTTAITDITFTVYDPEFELLTSGLFMPGGTVDFQTFRGEIYSTETGSAADGRGQVTVKSRARHVATLMRRRGPKVMRNASATHFVVTECRAAGIRVVAQSTARRATVARDTGGNNSSWTTFERLAQEEGFVMYESGGTVFFGQPTWLLARDTKQIMRVTYATGGPDDMIGVPVFTDSTDIAGYRATFDVDRERLSNFMPGQRIQIRFPPYGAQRYLVTALSFPIAGGGVASVTAERAVDPRPTGPIKPGLGGGGGSGGGSGGGGGSRGGSGGHGPHTLGALLHAAGFRGHALDVACGIAIAESGGYANGRWFVNAHILGDRSLETAKWGPSVGCFQIRSLRHPSHYSGLDRRRWQSKLMSAPYNAKTAFLFSGGGKNWGPWTTWHTGAYRRGMGKTNALVRGWAGAPTGGGGGGSSGGGGGGGGTGPTGRKSAHDFVTLCLRQAGDRYRYGAEVNLNDPNPSVFDCSELIQWAAHRVGCFMPDGSGNQRAWMARKGTLMSVDRGLATRGAVLWIPGHVAVSLGGHKGTIEATNRQYGVRTWGPHRSFHWQAAGRVPGMRY